MSITSEAHILVQRKPSVVVSKRVEHNDRPTACMSAAASHFSAFFNTESSK